MKERRVRRSSDREEALDCLLGAVAREEAGCGIALLDERGRLLVGAGTGRKAWAAARVAQGRSVASGAGFVSRRIRSYDGEVTLAAIGLVRGQSAMRAAAEGVERIMSSPALR